MVFRCDQVKLTFLYFSQPDANAKAPHGTVRHVNIHKNKWRTPFTSSTTLVCGVCGTGRTWCVILTQWGRVTYICVSKLTNLGSDNALSPGRRQAMIWTNTGISIIGPLEKIFSEILIEIITSSYNASENVDCKMASISSRPQWVNILKTVLPLAYLGESFILKILYSVSGCHVYLYLYRFSFIKWNGSNAKIMIFSNSRLDLQQSCTFNNPDACSTNSTYSLQWWHKYVYKSEIFTIALPLRIKGMAIY